MGESKTTQHAGILERLDIDLPVRLLGFGLIYAWGVCSWNIPLSASADAAVSGANSAWLISAVLTPLVCIAIAFIGRSRELSDFRSLYVVGPALCLVGTVALIACDYTGGLLNGLLALIAGIGTGCGPAILIVLWGCLFARIETSITETVIPASFVATLVCALIIPTMPVPLANAVVAALPIASGALLVLSRNGVESQSIPTEDVACLKPFDIAPHTVVRMMAVIFAIYALGCAAPAESPVTLSASVEAYATVVGMLFAVALSAGIVLFARRVNIASLYQWTAVPFVLGIVAMPIESEPVAFFARALMNAVCTGIEIVTVLYFVRLSQRSRQSTTIFVGLGGAASYGGVLVGYSMVSYLQNGTGAAFDDAFVCLVMLGVFSLISLLVPRHDEALEPEQTALPAADEDVAAHDAQAVADSYVDEMDSVVAHRSAVAASYGLSKRETEIFLMLAQGRSRPYIRDSLYLSKNTVATHVRHIYEKMGIHSQQELIDLVEK